MGGIIVRRRGIRERIAASSEAVFQESRWGGRRNLAAHGDRSGALRIGIPVKSILTGLFAMPGMG